MSCRSASGGALSSTGDFADTKAMRRGTHCAGALSIALASLCILSSSAAAQPGDSETSRADRIAGAIYYEGVPYEEARDLSEAEVARLIELLDDPAQLRAHPNILVALGMSGSPAAFDAIAGYALRGSSGELDRLEFRARRSIAPAMGHLARADGRALAWLMRAATADAAAPGQRFRQLGPERIAELMRRGAITGLALSARPSAARRLAELAATPGADPRLVEHCREALRLHARVAREGPAAVLQAEFGAAR